MVVYWVLVFQLPARIVQEINRVCRNFLWNGPDPTTSNALIGYEVLCYPYAEGGLGILDLEKTNTTTILRNVWHIITNNNTLWVAWVQINLVKGRSFWQLYIPCECSWS